MRPYREFERIVPMALTCQHCGQKSEEIFQRRGGFTAITDDRGSQVLICRSCRNTRSLFPKSAELEADYEA